MWARRGLKRWETRVRRSPFSYASMIAWLDVLPIREMSVAAQTGQLSAPRVAICFSLDLESAERRLTRIGATALESGPITQRFTTLQQRNRTSGHESGDSSGESGLAAYETVDGRIPPSDAFAELSRKTPTRRCRVFLQRHDSESTKRRLRSASSRPTVSVIGKTVTGKSTLKEALARQVSICSTRALRLIRRASLRSGLHTSSRRRSLRRSAVRRP